MITARYRILKPIAAFSILLPLASLAADLTATNAPPATAPQASTAVAQTNAASDEVLRAYLQLQEQIHEAQLAIERNRQAADDAAAKSAAAVGDRLTLIEQAVSAQHTTQEAVQRANRTTLTVVSAFAALGCLAVLATAYFQWRAVNRLTAIASTMPAGRGLGPLPAVAALGMGDSPLPALGSGSAPDSRLLGAIERLEKRIRELDAGAAPALNDQPPLENKILDLRPIDSTPAQPVAVAPPAPEKSPEISSILGKGQSLLNLGKFDEALACFEQVLAVEPGNGDALLKKGTALERLRRPQEALSCYDQAIAADASMTIAYLYKGGLYNRMERFSEALQCYEQALRSQEKRRAS